MECWEKYSIYVFYRIFRWNLNTVECWVVLRSVVFIAFTGWNLNTVECWGSQSILSLLFFNSMKSKHSGMLRFSELVKRSRDLWWNLNTVECWDGTKHLSQQQHFGWNLNTVECWVTIDRALDTRSIDEI